MSDRTNEPGVDDDELLERLDAGLPPRSDEEARARAPYERLRAQVRDLPPTEPEPGWEERARDRFRLRTGRRRRPAWAATGVAVAGVAVAAGLGLWLAFGWRDRDRSAPQVAALDVRVVTPEGTVRRAPDAGERAARGSTLELRIPRAARGELRLYRDTQLIARCPGDSGCRDEEAAVVLSIVLDRDGMYRPLVLAGPGEIPAPDPAGLDVDALAARQAGIAVSLSPPILVGP